MDTFHLKGSFESWKLERKRHINIESCEDKKIEVIDEFGRKRLVTENKSSPENDFFLIDKDFQKFKGPGFYRFSSNPVDRFAQQTNILHFSKLLTEGKLSCDKERLERIRKYKKRNARLFDLKSKQIDSG